MEEKERRESLEAAIRDAMAPRAPSPAESRRRMHQPATGLPPRLLVLTMLLTWSLIAWIWFSQPAFLFGPRVAAEVSPATQEASLRFALYLERSRVDSYRQRQGRLPTDLSVTGPVEDGVSMVRAGEGYDLIGRRGILELRLTDRMNADSFLGTSLDVLRRAADR
jgi:hypothetical protein